MNKEHLEILSRLGFRVHKNGSGIQYSIRDGDHKIGITVNNKNPDGIIWAYCLDEHGNKSSDLLSEEEVNNLPIIQRYRAICEGKEELPEQTPETSEQHQLANDMRWAIREAVTIFCEEVEDQVKIPVPDVFIEKVGVTLFIAKRDTRGW